VILTQEEWSAQGQSLSFLARNGLPVLDHYEFKTAEPLAFREAQQKAYDETEALHAKGIRKIVESLSTGGGKTLFACEVSRRALIKNPNQTIFFIVNRDTLVQNAKHAFEKQLGEKVGIIQGDKLLHLNRQIQIVSAQTLNNRLNSEILRNILLSLNVKEIWVDECHYSEKGVNRFLNYLEKEKREYNLYGLTATAYPIHLSKTYQAMVKPYFIQDLINQGVLVDYKLLCMIGSGIDTKKIKKDANGEYNENSAGEEVQKLLVIGNPAKDWHENDETRNQHTIVFCPNKTSCNAVYDHFMESDLVPHDEIGVMHSDYATEENRRTLEGAKSGRIRIIISVNQLREGVDLPHFTHAIDFQPMADNKAKPDEPKSLTTYIQKMGRVLRSFAGGTKVLINGIHSIIPVGQDIPEDAEILEVLPKKEYAIVRDYTEVNRFASPIEIDSRYDSLIEGNDDKEDIKEREEKTLNDLENDNAEALLPPKIICPSCHSEIVTPPFCQCGEKIERVESYIAPSVEIEFKDGYCVVARIPKDYQDKLDKRKAEKEKANRPKNVNYKKLTQDQAVNVMTAVMMKIDGTDRDMKSRGKNGYKPETKKKMYHAMSKSILGEQFPNQGDLKLEAYDQFKKARNNLKLQADLNKYVAKVTAEQRKYRSKK
jgi:superfamily II DNA or RNA helicase